MGFLMAMWALELLVALSTSLVMACTGLRLDQEVPRLLEEGRQ
jgi:hypothetical protein